MVIHHMRVSDSRAGAEISLCLDVVHILLEEGAPFLCYSEVCYGLALALQLRYWPFGMKIILNS